MVLEFRIIGDEIYFGGELFAKITMPLSVMRDRAEQQPDYANIELDAMKAEIAQTVIGNACQLIAKWAEDSEDDEIAPEDAVTEITELLENTEEDELLK